MCPDLVPTLSRLQSATGPRGEGLSPTRPALPLRSQVPDLQALYAKARVNGVTDLVWLSGEQARHMEPNLRAAAAFLSPSTGTGARAHAPPRPRRLARALAGPCPPATSHSTETATGGRGMGRRISSPGAAARAGILDSHTYMSALLADAEAAGASLAVASRVVGGQVPPPRLPSPGAASAGLEGGSGAAGPLVQAPGQRPGVLLEVC